MIKVTLTGVKELDTVFKKMGTSLTHKILSAAHADAGKILVQAEKQAVPKRTGTLERSIGIERVAVKKASSIGEVRIGPRRGRYKGYHGGIVEFGTRPRRTKGKGRYRRPAYRGIMIKRPFVAPSFNRTKDRIERNINTSIGKVLSRTMKRYAKR